MHGGAKNPNILQVKSEQYSRFTGEDNLISWVSIEAPADKNILFSLIHACEITMNSKLASAVAALGLLALSSFADGTPVIR